MRHRKSVETAQLVKLPPVPAEDADVAGEGGRIAGYIRDAAKAPGAQPLDQCTVRAGAGWIEYRDHGSPKPGPVQHLGRVAPVHPRPRRPAQVMPGVANGLLVPLDPDHRAARTDGRCQDAREQSGSAEKVERRLARLWPQSVANRLSQRVGCPWMYLPEAGRAHPPVPACRPLPQISRRSRPA